jgi:dipeptidyl-peptidase-4
MNFHFLTICFIERICPLPPPPIQVAGVEWAVRAGLADPKRVAVAGWSYGGYLSAMCLATAPKTFQAAVCGAPVTDWRLYDTAYTERYVNMFTRLAPEKGKTYEMEQ